MGFLPNIADLGTEFKDEIMGGAKKVAMGAVIIGGLVIFGPMIPGMLARAARGTAKFGKVLVDVGGGAFSAGKQAGQNAVMKGIAEPVS